MPAARRLIINGDLLENCEHRLRRKHWKVLSQLRGLSDELELIWVKGNHDPEDDSLAHLIGANYTDEYLVEEANLLCVHGDRWDNFLTDHPIITAIADFVYLRLQALNRHIAVHAKHNSKTFVRCVDKVREEALKYAGKHQIVCGHTHHAEHTGTYYNTGSWTETDCFYLAVGDKCELVRV